MVNRNLLFYLYRMDKLFWVAGTTVFMSNLSVITDRACSAQTIIADENRRPGTFFLPSSLSLSPLPPPSSLMHIHVPTNSPQLLWQLTGSMTSSSGY